MIFKNIFLFIISEINKAFSGSGLHRYALLAYEQPALINPQYSGIAGFNVQDFVKANNLAAAARWELFPRSGW